MNNTLTIRNCQAVLPDQVVAHATVRIENGVIVKIASDAPTTDGQVLDAQGALLGPGFVDVHCHGDGMTRYFDDPETVSKNLLQQGTTTVLATLGYPDMRKDGLTGQLREFNNRAGMNTRGILGGIHLEGPYVNRKYGAQTTRGVIKNPDAPGIPCFAR